jgi:sigma-B regulation protein RsbU (phosphoserine phosphatase)
MTTARAFLRYGVHNDEGPARLVSEVNWFLTNDTADTGRFMTLFYLEIEQSEQNLKWVRAGHDPAILYDPRTQGFSELGGDGIVLGIDEDYIFQENNRQGWTPGTIIVISTDGITEAGDEKGEMFGRERLQKVIRKHADESSQVILDSIMKSLHAFQGSAPQEDDITLVVIKLTG